MREVGQGRSPSTSSRSHLVVLGVKTAPGDEATTKHWKGRHHGKYLRAAAIC